MPNPDLEGQGLSFVRPLLDQSSKGELARDLVPASIALGIIETRAPPPRQGGMPRVEQGLYGIQNGNVEMSLAICRRRDHNIIAIRGVARIFSDGRTFFETQ